MIGHSGAFIFTPEDHEQGVPERELEAGRTSGKAVNERWHLRKDGSRFWASGMLSALNDGDGKLDGFVKIARDLTERREAQEAQSRALERSEQRFFQAFNAGPVAACITTLEKDAFLNVNDALLRLTGYTREEVLGKSILELGMWSSNEDREVLKRAQEGSGSFRDLELHLCIRSGEVRNILASGEVIRLDGEEGNLKMFFDITERKRNEEELVQAIQEVMKDTAWFSQQVLERLAHVRTESDEPAPMIELTTRERQVLELLAKGLSNKAIATELRIATQTVRNYISTLYDKLGVHSRAEAIVWARERGIVGF